MANKHKGQVSFEAGGKTYTLRLDVNALIELQDALGFEDDEKFLAYCSNLNGIRRVRTFLTQALQLSHQGTTEQEVGDIITDLGLDEANRLLVRALQWAFPEPDPQAKAPKGKGRSPGASSS